MATMRVRWQVVCFAALAAWLVGGCDKLQQMGGGSGSAPADTAGGRSTTSTQFAGTYRSNWGTTTFSQQGTQVTAGYPNGTMTCNASGSTLDCDWREAAAAGKAKLTKLPNGNIEGTWGTGSSATNGGAWTFVFDSVPAVTTGPTENFAGVYKSNWGQTTFTQQGTSVTAKYPKGTMTCTAAGNTLDCEWREASAFGRAKLVKQSNGTLSGTWGDGSSATSGGPWLFTPG